MLKKLFMEIKQRKTKKKINKIKENLVFIERINLLIEKIENFKIKFIEITIYAQDIDLTSYYLSHNIILKITLINIILKQKMKQ